MTPNKFIAIDLGSTAITAMAAEVDEDNFLKILGVESKPANDVRYGVVEQATGAAFKINELLKMLENSTRIPDINFLSVSVGARSMRNIQVNVSRAIGASNTVNEQLLTDLMADAEKKIKGDSVAIFEVIPLSYNLDGVVMDDPEGKTGKQLIGKYNVVYGNKLIAEKLEGCLERTTKIIEYRCLSVDALGTAVLDEHEKEEGCVLLNLGATTTSFAIFEHGAIQHLNVIPLGGKTITNDIQEFGLNESNAEKLKTKVGKALESLIHEEIYILVPALDTNAPDIKVSNKLLSMAIEARLDEILNPTFDAIKNYKGTIKHGIVLTGGASKQQGLSEYLLERTGLNARFGTFTDWLSENTDPKFNDPRYSQLAGTILLQHEYREQNPLDVQSKKIKEPKIKSSNIKESASNLMLKFFSEDKKII